MATKAETETLSIESTQFEEASVVLTRAFLFDPLTSAIIPDLETRRLVLFHFFYSSISYLYGDSTANIHIVCDKEGSSKKCIKGVSLWTKGHVYGVWFYFLTIIRLLWFVGFRMIFIGINVVKEYRNNYVTTSNDIMKGKKYFYLDVIGVEPCTKGKGYGTTCIKKQLDVADRLNQPCYLESSNPKNIPFYEKNGFSVQQVTPVFGVPIYMMTREPKKKLE